MFRFLIPCISLVAHTVADPEVSKFMALAAGPKLRPKSAVFVPTSLPIDTPATSVGTVGRATVNNPGPMGNLQKGMVQLDGENDPMWSQIADVAASQSQKQGASNEAAGKQFADLLLAGAFGIGAAVGAFLYSNIDRLVNANPIRNMNNQNGSELQFVGAGGVPLLRFGSPSAVGLEETRAFPPPSPNVKTMKTGDLTLMNFDPLGLTDPPSKLASDQRAEISHARIVLLVARRCPSPVASERNSDDELDDVPEARRKKERNSPSLGDKLKSLDDQIWTSLDKPIFDPSEDGGRDEPELLRKFKDMVKNDYANAEALYVGGVLAVLLVLSMLGVGVYKHCFFMPDQSCPLFEVENPLEKALDNWEAQERFRSELASASLDFLQRHPKQ